MADQTIGGTVIAALVGAVGWLGKRLYDAPRPDEYKRLMAENTELRVSVAAAAVEAKRLYDAREVELRELRRQLDELHGSVAAAERRGPRTDRGGRDP